MAGIGFFGAGLAQGLGQGLMQGEALKRQRALQEAYLKHQGFQEQMAKEAMARQQEQMYMKPYEEILGRVPGAAGPVMGAMEQERSYRRDPSAFRFTVPGRQADEFGNFSVPDQALAGQPAYSAFQEDFGQKVAEAQRKQMMLAPEMAFYRSLMSAQGRQAVTGDPFEQSRARAEGADVGHLSFGPELRRREAGAGAEGAFKAVRNPDGSFTLTQTGTTVRPPGGGAEGPAVERMPTPAEEAEIRQTLEFRDHAYSLLKAMQSGKMPVGGRIRTGLSDISGEIGSALGMQNPVLFSNPDLNSFRKWLMQDMITRARKQGGVRMAGSPQMFEKYDVKNFPNLERMDPATIKALAQTAVNDAEIQIHNSREYLSSQGKSTRMLDEHQEQIQTPEQIMGKATRGSAPPAPGGRLTLPGREEQSLDDATEAVLRNAGARRR